MTTPRTLALVSLTAAMAGTLALGACTRATSRPALDEPRLMEARRPSIRFDNDAHEHVHVYLIGERREWLLGRVEPGAVATLRIPEASLVGSAGFVRLAAISGERLTLQAARDARATFTIAQPAGTILSQQWKLAQGQLTPVWLGTARVGARHD